MIKRYIQCATFRVVVHAKGDCAEEPQLPCIAFKDLWRGCGYLMGRGGLNVLWGC